jgi:hypothetical protein
LPDSSLAGQEHGRTIPLPDFSARPPLGAMLKPASAREGAVEHASLPAVPGKTRRTE